jgi:hypothetical protein
MRPVIVITALALVGAAARFGAEADIGSLAQKLPFAEDVSDAQAAVEARCGELPGWQRPSCEDELAQRFAQGEVSPEAVLRIHCTRIGTVWSQVMPEPPALCAARFGGWLSG